MTPMGHPSHRGPGLWADACLLCGAQRDDVLMKECPMVVIERSEFERLKMLDEQIEERRQDWMEQE